MCNENNSRFDSSELATKVINLLRLMFSLYFCKLTRSLCLNTAFRCQSYDYNATGAQVCRLSHHNTLTLSQIRDPFLAVPDASTKELSACYNVSVDCRAGDMVATVRTSKIFQGKLYAKGAPNSCALDVQNSLEFALRLPYTDLECGVQREAMGRYSTEVKQNFRSCTF